MSSKKEIANMRFLPSDSLDDAIESLGKTIKEMEDDGMKGSAPWMIANLMIETAKESSKSSKFDYHVYLEIDTLEDDPQEVADYLRDSWEEYKDSPVYKAIQEVESNGE